MNLARIRQTHDLKLPSPPTHIQAPANTQEILRNVIRFLNSPKYCPTAHQCLTKHLPAPDAELENSLLLWNDRRGEDRASSHGFIASISRLKPAVPSSLPLNCIIIITTWQMLLLGCSSLHTSLLLCDCVRSKTQTSVSPCHFILLLYGMNSSSQQSITT